MVVTSAVFKHLLLQSRLDYACPIRDDLSLNLFGCKLISAELDFFLLDCLLMTRFFIIFDFAFWAFLLKYFILNASVILNATIT